MHGVRRRARILRYVRFPKESMIPVVVRCARHINTFASKPEQAGQATRPGHIYIYIYIGP